MQYLDPDMFSRELEFPSTLKLKQISAAVSLPCTTCTHSFPLVWGGEGTKATLCHMLQNLIILSAVSYFCDSYSLGKEGQNAEVVLGKQGK